MLSICLVKVKSNNCTHITGCHIPFVVFINNSFSHFVNNLHFFASFFEFIYKSKHVPAKPSGNVSNTFAKTFVEDHKHAEHKKEMAKIELVEAIYKNI